MKNIKTEILSVLIVDDVDFNLKLLKNTLKKIPYVKVIEAKSGLEAIDIAVKEDVALILLDITMPEMDGFEVAEILANNTESKDIPIIFNTAVMHDEESVFKGYKLGGVDYLLKPTPSLFIRKKVELYLNMQRYKRELANKINKENQAQVYKENEELSKKLENSVDIQIALRNAITKTKELILKSNTAKHAKSSFLANMSHEIRTPIGGIIGVVNLLLEETKNPDEIKILETISRTADSLLIKINNILDISKLDAGKISSECINFNIKSIIDELKSSFLQSCENRNIVIKEIIPTETPLTLKGDSLRITQILTNLLSNSIKFSPENSTIVIEIKSKQIDNEKYEFSFLVKDEGKGIKKKILSTIFDLDKSATNLLDDKKDPNQGIGLGLPLSYKFAKLLDGDLKINKYKQGTELELTIPLLKNNDDIIKKSTIKEITDLTDIKILMAEDNMINQKLGKKLLEKLGAKVKIAKDGLIAFESYKTALSADESFDYILMDCNMPNMDGFESTKAIRKWEKDNKIDKGIIIIALTADSIEDAKEGCLEAGMNDCLSKPLKKDKLLTILSEVSGE